MTTPTMSESAVIARKVPAFMGSLAAVMPMPPAVNRRIDPGHIHHTGRRWRGVNHPRLRAINNRAEHPYLGINREMADARVHRHRRFHHRMGAAHLGQTQAQQAEHRDSSGKWQFE